MTRRDGFSGATGTTWGYDANGNRTTVNGVTVGYYDDHDRLTYYPTLPYVHNANGDRTSKGTGLSATNYAYD